MEKRVRDLVSIAAMCVCVWDDVQALESAMVENIKPWRPLEVTLSCRLD